MMQDVTGFRLVKALAVLSAAGLTVSAVKTAMPPGKRTSDREPDGNARVIRQIWLEGTGAVELTVCNPDTL